MNDKRQDGIETIGVVRSSRTQRGDDDWDEEVSRIELDSRFGPDALAGLDTFSHIEVVFRFHALTDDQVTTDARHPRRNTDWPRVGIFAQRASKRPNRLAVSVCTLLSVDGTTIHVRGLDAIDGTPVLDIKPVMSAFVPRGELVEPPWAKELMRGYWRKEAE